MTTLIKRNTMVPTKNTNNFSTYADKPLLSAMVNIMQIRSPHIACCKRRW